MFRLDLPRNVFALIQIAERQISQTLLINLLVVTVALSGCSNGLGDLYSPRELRDTLREAGGWVPLVIPDSKYRAGSIIFVNETDGKPRWVDHMDACVKATDFDKFLEVGAVPGISFTKDAAFDANVLLNIRGVKAGPSFQRVSKVTLSIDDHSAVAMRLIKFRTWFSELDDADYISRINPCLDALESASTYLVSEAFVLEKASYSLFTETGVRLELDLSEIGDILRFEPNVEYSVSTDGSLMIDEPVVLAVRRAIRVDGAFALLAVEGPPGANSADGHLDRWFLSSTE